MLARTLSRRAAAATAALTGAAATTSVASCDAGQPLSLYQQLTNVPPFDPHGSRFDMSTYGGRVLHFFSVIGDLTTLATTQAQIDHHRQILSEAEAKPRPSDAELWRARQVLEAVQHPQTGEVIPAVLRFSFFAPANLVICAGLLSSAASLPRSAFFQWANQTYNVAVNYANRSSGDVSAETLGLAYCAATSSSLAVALGLQAAGSRLFSGRLVRVTLTLRLEPRTPSLALLCTRLGHACGAAADSADARRVGGRRREPSHDARARAAPRRRRGGAPLPCSSSSSSPWTCRAPRTLCRGVPRPPGPQAADGTPLGESVAAARVALLQCSAARVVSPLVESATYPA